jgi:hypothetical protein
VPLSNIIIVDNAVYSFGEQLDNGIPITPFKEDPNDTEFKHLICHLERCVQSEDMREVNRAVFRFSELLKYQFEGFINFYDFEECEQIMEEDEVQFCPLIQGSGTGSDSVLIQKQGLGRSVLNALDELK